jgi:hypothetical protein
MHVAINAIMVRHYAFSMLTVVLDKIFILQYELRLYLLLDKKKKNIFTINNLRNKLLMGTGLFH